MSKGPRFSIIPAAFVRDDRPSIVHFRVLNLLGTYTDKAGWCVRSQIKMASELGVARETVNRAIGELVEWGYVEKTGQGQSRRSVCFYRVVMDPKEPPEAMDDTAATGGGSVTKPSHGGVTLQVTPV